jgi:hypothetical protein
VSILIEEEINCVLLSFQQPKCGGGGEDLCKCKVFLISKLSAISWRPVLVVEETWLPNNSYKLSLIRRGFAPGFVNYKKGCTRLATTSDKVYQLLAHGRWFSPGTPVSSTTKTGRHDIAESLEIRNTLHLHKSSPPPPP